MNHTETIIDIINQSEHPFQYEDSTYEKITVEGKTYDELHYDLELGCFTCRLDTLSKDDIPKHGYIVTNDEWEPDAFYQNGVLVYSEALKSLVDIKGPYGFTYKTDTNGKYQKLSAIDNTPFFIRVCGLSSNELMRLTRVNENNYYTYRTYRDIEVHQNDLKQIFQHEHGRYDSFRRETLVNVKDNPYLHIRRMKYGSYNTVVLFDSKDSAEKVLSYNQFGQFHNGMFQVIPISIDETHLDFTHGNGRGRTTYGFHNKCEIAEMHAEPAYSVIQDASADDQFVHLDYRFYKVSKTPFNTSALSEPTFISILTVDSVRYIFQQQSAYLAKPDHKEGHFIVANNTFHPLPYWFKQIWLALKENRDWSVTKGVKGSIIIDIDDGDEQEWIKLANQASNEPGIDAFTEADVLFIKALNDPLTNEILALYKNQDKALFNNEVIKDSTITTIVNTLARAPVDNGYSHPSPNQPTPIVLPHLILPLVMISCAMCAYTGVIGLPAFTMALMIGSKVGFIGLQIGIYQNKNNFMQGPWMSHNAIAFGLAAIAYCALMTNPLAALIAVATVMTLAPLASVTSHSLFDQYNNNTSQPDKSLSPYNV